MEIKMTEEKLKKILKDSEPIFKQIEEIGQQLRTTTKLDESFYYKSLDELSGCYTYLSPLLKKIEAVKTNDELKEYIRRKVEIEEAGTKFVDAAVTKEASYSVKDLRLVRNIVSGYLSATENNINTCKKHMDGYKKEREMD